MRVPNWVQAVAVIAAVAVLVWGMQVWESSVYRRGYEAAEAEAKAREEETSKRAALAKIAADQAAREKDREDRRWRDQLNAQRYQENQRYERTIADLRDDARRGEHGMSVAVTADSLPRCLTAGDPAAAAGFGGETRADVVPEVADAVLSAAEDLARGVRDRNDYIDLYNRARARCSEK